MKLPLLFLLLIISLSTPAQITTDGSLGPQLNLSGPDFQIGPDLGQQYGSNLFHSFKDFNLLSHESATFSGPNHLQNVMSRVTGGNPSNLDGLIRSTIPNANMYFLNPNGIMFGPNAQLDVQGSFHASTADYLRLGEGGRFEVRNPSDSLLTVAPVEAFGFLSASPTALSIEDSQLSLSPGQTFSFVGGDINIKKGQLFAPSGRFNLASVAQPGEIDILNLDTASFEQQGTITLSEQTELNVSGLGAGKIVIRGGQFWSHDSTIQANTYAHQPGQNIDLKLTESVNLNGDVLAISNNTFGQGDAGHLIILTPHLEMTGSIISAGSAGLGKSGNVTIEAEQVILNHGGAIRSDTYGPGQGGQIKINAAESIVLEGQRIGNIALPGGLILADYPSEISSDTYSTGQAGSINLTTDQLKLIGGFIAGTSFGEAQAGNLTIHANQATLTKGASFSSSSIANGPGGNLDIVITDILSLYGKRTGSFSIHLGEDTFEYINNQTVIAVGALGTGPGGQVSITVPTLVIDDSAVIAASTVNTGNAGDIAITVKDLYLTQGGQINNSSGGLVGTQLIIGPGAGGIIRVNATNRITASGSDEQGSQSGIISNTLGPGQGGDIFIDTHHLTLTNQGTVSANSFGLGDAGNLQIKANEIHLSQGGEITSAAAQAVGGNLMIYTSTLLDLHKSQITTSVYGGIGNGGNIRLENPTFVVIDKGKIIAQADEGHGGNIRIVAEQFIASPDSLVNASSRLGLDGHVDIHSPAVDLDAMLVVLPDGFVEVQLKKCNIEEELDNPNTFTVKKRYLSTPLIK